MLNINHNTRDTMNKTLFFKSDFMTKGALNENLYNVPN